MGLKKLFIILILSFVLLPVTPVMAQEDTVSDIAKQLICQCGCGRVLAETTPGGRIRDEMIAIIEQKLAQGESQEEILDYFVARYGEQVLASPPKKGFNLVVWALAPVAILGGGVVIYLAVKAWVRRGRQPPISARSEEEDEEYRKRLEKELEEFSEGGFR